MYGLPEQDYLQSYLQAAYAAPMLSREREAELAYRMKDGGRAGQRARDELVTAHLKLAARVARKYSYRGASFEDLVQEANIGLLIAADKFDISRGFRFSTFAFHWVRSQVQLYLANVAGGDVRLPLNRQREVRKLKDTIRSLEQRGVTVTEQVLSAELRVSVEVVRELSESMISEFSLNAPAGADSETEIGALIPDTNTPSPEALAIQANDRELVRKAVEGLPARDCAIITMRFGLDGEGERSLEEVGNVFDVSRERIRQLEVKAIERLRAVKALVPKGTKVLTKPRRNRIRASKRDV